jgi:hypothetical protein
MESLFSYAYKNTILYHYDSHLSALRDARVVCPAI